MSAGVFVQGHHEIAVTSAARGAEGFDEDTDRLADELETELFL